MYERNAERKKCDRNDSTCVDSSIIKIDALNVDLVLLFLMKDGVTLPKQIKVGQTAYNIGKIL